MYRKKTYKRINYMFGDLRRYYIPCFFMKRLPLYSVLLRFVFSCMWRSIICFCTFALRVVNTFILLSIFNFVK